MYAIVEIAGQQFKVEKGQQIFVNRLHEEEGSKVSFDKVLLIGNDGSTKIGAPTVAGASVEATVMQHLKGNKIIVFKKKRRKGYQTSNGHRQYLSKIQIESITESKPEKTKEIWHTKKVLVVQRTVVSPLVSDSE